MSYVLLYLEWSFNQLEFGEGCSQVTRYSNPFQDVIKSYFQKKPQTWTGQHFRSIPLLKSFSRHHQKLFPKNAKFELDNILDQNLYPNPFQDIIKSYAPKNPKFELDDILDQSLDFWFIWTNIACKWCKLFLRTFNHLHFWEGFQGLEFGWTLWVNTKTGKGIRIWVFFMPHEWTLSRNIFLQLCWVIYLLGKAFKGKA